VENGETSTSGKEINYVNVQDSSSTTAIFAYFYDEAQGINCRVLQSQKSTFIEKSFVSFAPSTQRTN